METYIARANIDHYVGMLNSDILLSPEKRQGIVTLLISEMEKLASGPEHLGFAEAKVADGRKRLQQVKRLRDDAQPSGRANAERLVVAVEATQELLNEFCRRLRARVNSQC